MMLQGSATAEAAALAEAAGLLSSIAVYARRLLID
jgi:hypothetical protein